MDNKHKKLRIIILISIACLFIISPILSLNLNPNSYKGGRSRDLKAANDRNRSAIAIMLGEFRASVSDIIFIKTETYLHNGVNYAAHLEGELSTVAGKNPEINMEGDSEDEHEHHEHEGGSVETAIKSPDKDFRGLIGDLHREVKPWRDPRKPHILTDGTELLPWYRVMTLSDPHNIRGYYLGIFWLKRINPDEAIDFAKEGIKNNPEAFQIYQTLGQVYFYKAQLIWGDDKNNPSAEAKKFILLSKDEYRKAAELAVKQRPASGPGASLEDYWNDYTEQDAYSAARFCVILEERYGDKALAAKLAKDFMKTLGDDFILKKYVN